VKKVSSRGSTAGLAGVRNLGPASVRWLAAVGIRDREKLEALGAPRAWARVRAAGFNASRNLLWALQGAILDLPWNELPPAMKETLRKQAEAELRELGVE